MMKRVVPALVILALGAVAQQTSRPQEQFPKRSVFSITEPVEIPGTVLNPGKYVIRMRAGAPQRNVLQIFNVLQVTDPEEKHIYATIFSMPDYNLAPPNKPLFSYYDGGPGLPKAIRAWFHPGENYGEQLVYPRSQAAEFAKIGNQSVLSMPSLEMQATAERAAQAPAPRRPQLLAQARPPGRLRELPKTASLLNVLAWGGLVCLLLAGIIRAIFRWIPDLDERHRWLKKLYRGGHATGMDVLETMEQLRQENRALAARIAAMSYQNYQLTRQLPDKQ